MPTKVASAPEADPFDSSTPTLETQDERNARIAREAHEKSVSDRIDEEIEKQRQLEKKTAKPIKLLLLGQSESGKSTTLKNFQLLYDPKTFRAERVSWRAVVHLNVIRSIHFILDIISRAIEDVNNSSYTSITPELEALHAILKDPVEQLYTLLIRRLTHANSSESEATVLPSTNGGYTRHALKELAINSTIPWKAAFNRLLMKGDRSSVSSRASNESGEIWNDPGDHGSTLQELAPHMIALWNSQDTQTVLAEHQIRLEVLSGFFLDSIERITARKYMPTDEDMMRARLKTLGVQEYKFKIATMGTTIRDWRVYDVGGHRSQRTAWAPYFDDMDAILFLAPISCFDQMLEEDSRVNRLEDSFNLWTMVIENKHLKNTNLILFMNKIDILQAKLAAGVRFSNHVVSYGDRPNDFPSITNYLKRKFEAILRRPSSTRLFYCHLTTVTDIKSMKSIITGLKDMLIRQNLAKSSLIS